MRTVLRIRFVAHLKLSGRGPVKGLTSLISAQKTAATAQVKVCALCWGFLLTESAGICVKSELNERTACSRIRFLASATRICLPERLECSELVSFASFNLKLPFLEDFATLWKDVWCATLALPTDKTGSEQVAARSPRLLHRVGLALQYLQLQLFKHVQT